MVFDGTGSVWGNTGCNLVLLGHYNLVLIGFEWYWVNKGLLCLYTLKKLMVTSTNRPTDRANIEQSASGSWKGDICRYLPRAGRHLQSTCQQPEGGAQVELG